MHVPGTYFRSGHAKRLRAHVVREHGDGLAVVCDASLAIVAEVGPEDYRFGIDLPGQPVELEFRDGSVFVPDSATHRWPSQSRRAGIATWLETNRLVVVLALLLSPLALYWIYSSGMPVAAAWSVQFVPDSVKEELGKQTHSILEEWAFEPSELGERDQASVEAIWDSARENLALEHQHYELRFLKAPEIGANAFALPDGTVIVTDELVYLLRGNPDAMLAILLHEMGHVEHEHGLRLIAQSIGSALVLGAVFGDLEGLTEMFLGSGATLVQNAFSRDMEREADTYAIAHLETLDKSPRAFAEALTALMESHGAGVSEETSKTLSYFQSHPAIEERINEALRAAE